MSLVEVREKKSPESVLYIDMLEVQRLCSSPVQRGSLKGPDCWGAHLPWSSPRSSVDIGSKTLQNTVGEHQQRLRSNVRYR